MAKIKYYARENKSLGTHSYYAVPVPNGTLTFDELCEEACRNTSIEPTLMRAAVMEYINAVQTNLLKGFRVPIGEQFITIYPYLNASVKDMWDDDGNKVVATPERLNANLGKSTLGSSIAPRFCRKFADSVSWQRVDEKMGAEMKGEE